MRVISDATLTEAIQYYKTFPSEPTIKPDSVFPIDLPIAKEDLIQKINLFNLLDRLSNLKDKQVLILCHGTPEGLALRLVPGSDAKAGADELRHLIQLDNARKQPKEIGKLPADKREAAWVALLKGLRKMDSKPLVAPENLPGQSEAAYQKLFDQALANGARELFLSRAQLDHLLDKRDKVMGKFDRLEFRSCNSGRDQKTMSAICRFFGAKQVIAPDTVAFTMTFPTTKSHIMPAFEQDTDRNVLSQTKRVLGARFGYAAPIYHGNRPEDVPPARMFDVTTAPGNELFIRAWLTSVHPHKFAGWMVAKNSVVVRKWIEKKLMGDTSRYHDGAPLVISGLWLRDDKDVPLRTALNIKNDPLAPSSADMPFALPCEPEYRQHLVSAGATVAP